MTTLYATLARAIDTMHCAGKTVMLWSDPGMGKTSFVTKTLAGRDTVTYPDGTTHPVAHSLTIIPAAMDTGDLLGIPTLNDLHAHPSAVAATPAAYNTSTMTPADSANQAPEGWHRLTATEFATPSWALEANSHAAYGLTYVLVDEFPAADMRVHNIFLNVIEDMRLPNGFRLHPNVKFVLAGNMNRSGVRGMTELSSAMTSRIAHFDMEPDLKDWSRGITAGFSLDVAAYTPVVHEADTESERRGKATAQVVSFLDSNPALYNPSSSNTKVDRTRGWYNPRTWANAIEILALTEGVDHTERMNMVEALVGNEARVRLSDHLTHLHIPTADEMIKDPSVLADLNSASAYVALSTLMQVCLSRTIKAVDDEVEKTGTKRMALIAREVLPKQTAALWDMVTVWNEMDTRHDNIAVSIMTEHFRDMYTYMGRYLVAPQEDKKSLDERFIAAHHDIKAMFDELN